MKRSYILFGLYIIMFFGETITGKDIEFTTYLGMLVGIYIIQELESINSKLNNNTNK